MNYFTFTFTRDLFNKENRLSPEEMETLRAEFCNRENGSSEFVFDAEDLATLAYFESRTPDSFQSELHFGEGFDTDGPQVSMSYEEKMATPKVQRAMYFSLLGLEMADAILDSLENGTDLPDWILQAVSYNDEPITNRKARSLYPHAERRQEWEARRLARLQEENS